MKKKTLSLSLALTLCLGLLTLPAAAVSGPAWAEPALARWEACGKLDEGVDAAKAVTRGEAAALLNRVLPAAVTLDDAGAPLDRQELAQLLAEQFGFAATGTPNYQDAAGIRPELAGAVAALQQKGIMQGSEGYFRPDDTATYAEVVQTLTNAVHAAGPVTGVTVRPRSAEGVLAGGQKTQVNDGKFELAAVQKTAEGYAVTLQGLEALVGETANEAAPGQPEKDGKWMGLQFQFNGLVRADELEYSRDGVEWKAFEVSPAFSAAYATDSVMVYVSGTKEADAEAEEVEKDTVFYVRHGQEGQQFKFEVHYTPA